MDGEGRGRYWTACGRGRAPVFLTLVALLVLPLVVARGEASAAVQESENRILYRYHIDGRRSRVSFTFRGLALPFDAYFVLLGGEIFLSAGRPFEGASARLRVEAGSVRTDDPAKLRMLKNEVLEVDRHPAIELLVDSARQAEPPRRRGRERVYRVRGEGRLRLHGMEREVPLGFRMTDTGTELYVRGEGNLPLSDYGMRRPRLLLLVPGQDEVKVQVRLVAHPAPRKEVP